MKNVILIAGFDYEFTGNSFSTLCKNRYQRLIKKFPKETLNFTLFDVANGVIQINRKDTYTGARSWIKLPITYKPVLQSNYSKHQKGEENAFDQNPDGVISVTDVYSYIQDIGHVAPHSVIELSFFTHGWDGGPILVNSYDKLPKSRARDKDDKDVRIDKDFIPPNMSEEQKKFFNLAFHPDGIIWGWGCNFFRAFDLILRAIFVTTKYRQTPPGKLKDEDLLNLNFIQDSQKDGLVQFKAISQHILQGGVYSGKNMNKYSVSVTLSEIKDVFRAYLNNTFSGMISKKLGIITYGALLGTSSDFERPVANQLMVIPRKVPPYADDFSKHIDFYIQYLKIEIDPENRGYGKFV